MLDSAAGLEFNRARDAEEMALLLVDDAAGGGDVTLMGDSECEREMLTAFAVGGGSAVVDGTDASRC